MSSRRQRIEDLFEAALEVMPERRPDWLTNACGGDAAMEAEVRALLQAHDRAGGILDRPIPDLIPAGEEPGARLIGPYRIVRELGRGGMGVVYLATREDGQFRRRVALKVLRGSPDAEELYKRFMAERHILASLDHPNIAQLLDGGVTDGRLPYLVMEYVDGVPITEYCDRNRLGLHARLRLFQDVCAAVQHAHKNLVLHRDLKPGNILVNESGQVKLLDFGIAKLLNPVLSGIEQPITRTEYRVLTPEYASPEQIRGDALSTASDVYALGVVLYELLSGQPPYRLTTRAPQELNELICEREPERPSTIVTRVTDAATRTAVAATRDTTPDRLRRELRGDLDAIVMMALRKEAVRRYGSAEVLAQEITAYLEGHPVLAQRGSKRYRTLKFLRRHRVQTAAAALVTVSLLGGAAVAFWQWTAAERERERAEAALVEAEQALQQAREITGFLTSLFQASDPGETQSDETTARELLRRGIRRADQLDNQPIAQAAMFDAIARVQRGLGHYGDAHTLLERALANRERVRGPNHPDVAGTLLSIAEIMRLEGTYAEALSRAERAHTILQNALGPDHPEVARALSQMSQLQIYLGDLPTSVKLALRTAEIQSALPLGDTARFFGLLRLGNSYVRIGNYGAAERAFRRAMAEATRANGPDDSNAAEAMFLIGVVLRERGVDLDEAEQLTRRALAIRARKLGHDHPGTVGRYADLALLRSARGDHAEAIRLLREHVEILERVLGAEHPDISLAYASLGNGYIAARRPTEAAAAFRHGLDISNRTFGPEHSVTAGLYLRLGKALLDLGHLTEAEQAVRRSLAIRERALGTRVALVGFMKADLADVLIKEGRLTEAEAELQEGLAIADENGVHPEAADYRRLLRLSAEVYEKLGRKADAAKYRARLGI